VAYRALIRKFMLAWVCMEVNGTSMHHSDVILCVGAGLMIGINGARSFCPNAKGIHVIIDPASSLTIRASAYCWALIAF